MVIHSAYLVLNTVTPISYVNRSAGPGDGRYQSVMAHSVAGRTREIGIRMSFGAQTGGVMRLVLAKGMSLVGFRLGLARALAIARLLANVLFEVKPADPTAFIGAFIALLYVAFVANYVPARRATRIYPLMALRYE
jgi:ABC-type antimicrobial peptide transport system permease subunit